MKRLSTLFALTALAAASVALAQQQTTPQAEAQPPASPSQSQSQAPSDPNASTSSEDSNADKQAQPKALMMKDCMTQVQAANPTVPEKDIRDFCDKQVNSQSSPPN